MTGGSSAAACELALDPGASVKEKQAITRAIAVLHPTKGNRTNGTVRFEAVPEGLKVDAEVANLSKGSRHAFHVHVFGDCSAPDAMSAGDHFDFEGSSLKPPADIQHITGDLGELVADDSGKARLSATIEKASLQGPYTIIGRSVVVHTGPNDHSKPPDGAAGARLACGGIAIEAPPTTKQ